MATTVTRTYDGNNLTCIQGASSATVANTRASILGIWVSQADEGSPVANAHIQIAPLTAAGASDAAAIWRIRVKADGTQNYEPKTPSVLDHGFAAAITGDDESRAWIQWKGEPA
jgi:hypothetical protein